MSSSGLLPADDMIINSGTNSKFTSGENRINRLCVVDMAIVVAINKQVLKYLRLFILSSFSAW